MKITDLKSNPWDQSYLDSLGIKKPSFHAYMRKINSGIDKGKFAKLQHQQLSIAKTDSDKLSLSDLPNSVTLKAQQFRHVDKIIFENSGIANDFIQFWIETNSQRVGFCYGSYEKSEEIPLGIVAKVKAIYEPPQKNGTNKLELQDDQQISKIDQMAKACGLERIGWIVSDLLAKDTKTGTVQYIRNEDSHFVSAEELITAASFQLQHPNPCRMNDTTGFYGSKFVTVIASGDKECQIGFSGYQASNQAMDLVRSKVIVPTIDANELAYCLDSNDELHIPEVFYACKDEYNNDVKREAKPMPVEYLISDMNVTMPKEQKYSWSSSNKDVSFPIENRAHSSQQTFESFCRYLKHFCGDSISQGMLQQKFTEIFGNFHILVWFALEENTPGCGMVGVMDVIKVLSEPTQSNINMLINSGNWQTLLMLAREANQFGDDNDEIEMDDDISEAIKRSLADR